MGLKFTSTILRFFMILAGAGFVASAIVHLTAWAQVDLGLGNKVMLLHLGIFVVFPPVLIVTRGINQAKRTSWELVLRGCPPWVPRAMMGLLAYAVFNFGLFVFQSRSLPPNKMPPFLEFRGVSGHWMFFYALSCTTLWARLNAGRPVAKCRNGHRVTVGENFCPDCGVDLTGVFLHPVKAEQ